MAALDVHNDPNLLAFDTLNDLSSIITQATTALGTHNGYSSTATSSTLSSFRHCRKGFVRRSILALDRFPKELSSLFDSPSSSPPTAHSEAPAKLLDDSMNDIQLRPSLDMKLPCSHADDERPSRRTKFESRIYNFLTRSRSRSRSQVDLADKPKSSSKSRERMRRGTTDQRHKPASPVTATDGSKPVSRIPSRPISSTTSTTNSTVTPSTPKAKKRPASGLPTPSQIPAAQPIPETHHPPSRPTTPKPTTTKKKIQSLFSIPQALRRSSRSRSHSRPSSPQSSIRNAPPLPSKGSPYDDDPTPKPLHRIIPSSQSPHASRPPSPSPSTKPKTKPNKPKSSSRLSESSAPPTPGRSNSLKLPKIFSSSPARTTISGANALQPRSTNGNATTTTTTSSGSSSSKGNATAAASSSKISGSTTKSGLAQRRLSSSPYRRSIEPAFPHPYASHPTPSRIATASRKSPAITQTAAPGSVALSKSSGSTSTKSASASAAAPNPTTNHKANGHGNGNANADAPGSSSAQTTSKSPALSRLRESYQHHPGGASGGGPVKNASMDANYRYRGGNMSIVSEERESLSLSLSLSGSGTRKSGGGGTEAASSLKGRTTPKVDLASTSSSGSSSVPCATTMEQQQQQTARYVTTVPSHSQLRQPTPGTTKMSAAVRSTKHGSFDFERPGWGLGAAIMQRTGSNGTAVTSASVQSKDSHVNMQHRESGICSGPGLAGVGTIMQRDKSLKRAKNTEEELKARERGKRLQEYIQKDSKHTTLVSANANGNAHASANGSASNHSDQLNASTSTTGTAHTTKTSSLGKVAGKRMLAASRAGGSGSGVGRFIGTAHHGLFAFEPPVPSPTRSTGSVGEANGHSTGGRSDRSARAVEERGKAREFGEKVIPRRPGSRGDRAPVPVPVPAPVPTSYIPRPGNRGRSLDLGIGLSWAPSKMKEAALLPSSTLFNRTTSNSSSLVRSASSVSTTARSASSSTTTNGGNDSSRSRRLRAQEDDVDFERERSKLGKEVAEVFRSVLDERGYGLFKTYVKQFDAHEIPFDGPLGIVEKVERLLRNAPDRGQDNRALLDKFVRIIFQTA